MNEQTPPPDPNSFQTYAPPPAAEPDPNAPKQTKPHKPLKAPLIIALILLPALIGIAAYFLLGGNKDKPKPASATVAKVTTTTAQTSTTGSGWTTVTSATLSLPKMGVTITLPTKLANKAVYKYDGANLDYVFSLSSIVDNKKCGQYYGDTDRDTSDGIQLWKYLGTANARGQLGNAANATESLSDYYTGNKPTAGSYITDQSGRKYYKVGDNFYVMFSDLTTYDQQNASDFSAGCPGVDANWQQDFLDAMPPAATST